MGLGGVVDQRKAVHGDGAPAALYGDARVRRHLHRGLRHGHAVDEALGVLLGRRDRRAAAVREAGGDHRGIGRRESAQRLPARGTVAEALVEDVERELDRLQGGAAPVLFRVLPGMRVLECQTLRRGRVEGRQVGRRQARVEGGARARERGAGARAVDQRDGIGLQVVGRGTRALVRIGHGAAVLEAPFARGNAAVDAARAGRGGGDDARARAVEGIRHLHHQGNVAAPRAVVRIGDGFRAGHHALARCRAALDVHVRAVEPAVTPVGGRVHQRPVVHVDGIAPQLIRRGLAARVARR